MRAIVLAGALAAMAVRASASPDITVRHSAGARFDHLPVSFEANIGQADASVRFLSHGRNADLFLTQGAVFLDLHPPGQEGQSQTPRLLELKFSGAKPNARLQGLDPLAGKANYFLGSDPGRWRVNAPTFARIKYNNIYPGVDLIFYGSAQELEYDLVVQPEVDPALIQLEFGGAEKIEITANGDVSLHLSGEGLRQRKPLIYQEIGGQRKTIPGQYVLQAANRVGFQIGDYDHSKPLIIDPVLAFSKIFGNGGATATGIAVDAQGNSYVTGNMTSPGFFTPGSFQTNLSGFANAFVTKFDTNGAVVYSTYLGGSSSDYGQGIAVDTKGDAFVTGFTYSTNFPTVNALQPTNGGQYDIFVTELNPAGNGLVYSTYLGGSSSDAANSIALDGQGNAVITGYTLSTNFPLTNAAQKIFGGQSDAFVAKFNTNGSALVFSTYLGGSQTENIGTFLSNPVGAVAVDAAGNAYVTGLTYSADFPVTNAFQNAKSNSYNTAFVTMFTPAGAMVRSTYLGGSFFDTGNAIAVDRQGDVYVGGATQSYDFPTKNALQPNFSGYGALFIGDGFLTVFDPTGTNLIYSTYIGGSGDDQVSGIAVDGVGNVALTGFTTSPDFPLLNSVQGAGNQGFFASSNGVWSTSSAGLTNGNQHTQFGYFNNYSGNVAALLVDPSNPSILYLSAEPAGVFKSTDHGSTWTAMNNGLAGFYSVSGLAFDPQNPSTLLAWDYDGVSLTTDGAADWTSITNGLPGSGFPNVQTLAVDPVTPTTLYAGTGSYGIYKSSDDGNTWEALAGLTNHDVLDLLVDPQNPANVYAGCQGYYGVNLFQSTNFGTNWNLLGAGSLPQGSVSALALNPTNSAVLYAMVQGFGSSTLAVSTNHGASWSNLLESYGFTFTAMAIDPHSPNTMYLGTDQYSGLGVLQSTDGGLFWTSYGLNSDLINTLAIDPANGALVYAGVNGGQDAFVSVVYTNGALSFSSFFGGTGSDAGNAIAIDNLEGVHVAGVTASSDFPGVPTPATASPRNPRKLGGPNNQITETVDIDYDSDVAWALRFLGLLGPPPCPPASVIMANGSQTFAGNTTYTFAAGSGFTGAVLIDTGGGSHQPASWVIQGGAVPPGLTNGLTALYGNFSQPGTYTFTINATDNNGCPYSATFTFMVTNPPPTISGFSPSSGVPGTLATITGSGFSLVSSVTINGVEAAFNINSDNQISFYVPIGAGAGPIVLASPYGTASSTAAFFSTVPNVVTFGNPAFVSTLDSDGNLVLNCIVNRGSNNVTTTVHVRTQLLQVNPYLNDSCLDPYSPGFRLPPIMAVPSMDFGPIDTMLTFPPGVLTQNISIPITSFATPQNVKYFGVALYGPSSDAVIAAPWDYTVVSIHNTVPFNPVNVNVNLSPYAGGNLNYKLDWPIRMDLRYSYDLGRQWSEAPAVAPPVIGTLAFKTNPVFFSTEYSPSNRGSITLNVETAKGPGYLSQAVAVGNTGPAAPLTNGSVTLTNVPAGNSVPIQVQSFLTVETNSATGERTTYYVSIRYNVTVIAGVTNQIPIKVDISSIGEPPLAPCDCTPWAGLVGGTVDGVQKVEAAGGKYGDCPGTDPVVTITGPGASLTYNGGQRSFSPAADGTWTVTSVICGKTNSASITLP